jgi:IS30 family transposase
MQHYKQLTIEQRYQISGLLKAGLKATHIADEVGVNKSTISRELKRNKGQRGWRPKQAQELRDKRRQAYTNAKRFTQDDWEGVASLIRRDMSPDQAAERLALEDALQISHETIYQYIYTDKRRGGDLWQHLRSQKPRRKRYASGQERRGVIKNRVSIDERPEIVDQKSRLGDWEGDTVIGKNHRGALVTLAERKSRYVLAAQVPSKHAAGVRAAITALLKPHIDKCHTVTVDNGKEFADHEEISAELKADIYFAHPYHSWERGLNENSNGLIRQYFPKGMELADVTQEQVQMAMDRLNHRPRKVLGYRTPFEVFFGKTVRYTKPPLGVAL